MFPKQKLLRKISSPKRPPNYTRHIGDDLNPTEKRLFEAIAKGRIDVFRNILKNKHDEIDWKKKDSQGYTFLQVAVFHSRKEMIQQLIKEGCETEPGYSLACELGDHDLTLLIIKCLNQASVSNHDEKDTDEEIEANGIADTLTSAMQSSPTDDVDEIEDETKEQGSPEKRREQPFRPTQPDKTRYISNRHSRSVKSNSCNDSRSSSKSNSSSSTSSGSSKINEDLDEDEECLHSCLRDPKPLILAAAAEDFVSTQKLIKGGCHIPQPHQPYCTCHKCVDTKQTADPLEQAHNRLQVYKALASATYLILKESDPILAAILRCEDLHALAKIYPENKTEFEEMAENTSKLAVDLMSNCRNAKEVEELLTQDINNMHFKYGRLLLAVGLKHKTFVTHPSCQCVLSKLWFGKLFSVWMYWPMWRKFFHIIMHMLLAFFICTAYIIAPKRYCPNLAAIPFNRFIYSATSYLVFLGFLLFCAMYDEYNENHQVLLRWYDWYIAFWVLALLYKTIQDIYIERFVSYWTSWWTMYELVMVLIFFGACVCFLAGRSYYIIKPSRINSVKLIFVGSGLYSVAVTLAFMRVLQWFHLSHNFGHLIVSFSRMTEILFKLLIIFLVVLFAFSIGIHSLYKNFHPKNGEDNNNTEQKTSFMDYGTTIKTLFWALFGDGEADYAAVPSSYFWHLIKPIQNRSSEMIITPDENSFSVIIGYILWSLFHVAFVIILLNMLIAVMTNSFDKIQENCDIEWKFARTKLWMYFFEDYNAVPPPFNLFYFLVSLIKRMFRIFKCCRKICPESNNRDSEFVDSISLDIVVPKKYNSIGSKKTKYTETLKDLIQRYIHDKKMKRLNLAAK